MKATKKSTYVQFCKHMEELLKEHGAIKSDTLSYDWSMETPFGECLISIDDLYRSGLAVYCRFINEEKRKLVDTDHPFGMNPFSGKFNFHFGYVEESEAESCANKVFQGIKNGYKFI